LEATDELESLAVMSANDKQIDGEHYQLEIQPWDYITLNRLGYLEGNIIKYVTRHKEKHGVKDLEKAKHYIDKLIEVEYGTTQASQE
jgi:TPP-dependent 2-oxoacid decarboxylase